MSSLEFTTWNINETPDINPQNDTVRETQVLSNYYSYDDGTAEVGYGVFPASENGEGEVALQFNLKMQDTLRGVEIYWDQVWYDGVNPQSQLINIAVWDSITPGSDNENLLISLLMYHPQTTVHLVIPLLILLLCMFLIRFLWFKAKYTLDGFSFTSQP